MNPTRWRKDEEFARQMIAGANPVCIKRVTRFPLKSELDRGVFGDQDTKITEHHVEKNMGGMTVQQVHTHMQFFVRKICCFLLSESIYDHTCRLWKR